MQLIFLVIQIILAVAIIGIGVISVGIIGIFVYLYLL